MSVIAIKGVPFKATLQSMKAKLSKIIQGDFQVINFGTAPNFRKLPNPKAVKVLYVKLSPKLDPAVVTEHINSRTTFFAFVPQDVPSNLKPAMPKGTSKYPKKTRAIHSPAKLVMTVHNEILVEMQSKYLGLYNLAKKTGFKLLEQIARTIFDRLKTIAHSNQESVETEFKLSSAYRKLHPHFGDFQLILSTLHRIQDAAGAPRAQVSESHLMPAPQLPAVIDNVPIDKVQLACTKYSERIIKKVKEHIEGLQTAASGDSSEEEAARSRVREQLHKLNFYMPDIVREVISNHFVPLKSPFLKVRIYGEPYLPSKEHMSKVSKRCHAVAIQRSTWMYNLLKLSVPTHAYSTLFNMDGTEVANAKIYIRPSNIPLYVLPKPIKLEMFRELGGKGELEEVALDNEDDDNMAAETAMEDEM